MELGLNYNFRQDDGQRENRRPFLFFDFRFHFWFARCKEGSGSSQVRKAFSYDYRTNI